MTPPIPPPPRVPTLLLGLLLDPGARETVIGDLHESYIAIRAQRGPLAAWWWFWVQSAGSLVSCRITGQRRGDVRRLDYEPGAPPSARDLIRPAMRQFRDHPLYTMASAGSLALAIGAACASLAVAKHALLDPLPYRDGHEVVSLLTFADGMTSAVSPHVLHDLRVSRSPLVEFAPIRPTGAAYVTDEGTETISVSYVDGDYFKLLGVPPALGRVWTANETDAVVVSAAFWRDRLGRRQDVVGSAIVVDGQPRTVVGVMSEQFTPPYFWGADLWAPLDMGTLMSDIRARRTLTILARRAPGTTQAELDAYLAVFSRQMQERFPQEHGGQTWLARPLREELLGVGSQSMLLATAAAAVLLLLIVGANIAGLSAAHAVAVRHQLAVRAALGATRGRLFLEQLVDSLVLAALGSLAGLWIAFGLMRVAIRYQEDFLPRLAPLSIDATTIVVTLAAGLLIGLSAGLLPRSLISASPHDALRRARGSSADVRITATRSALVSAQVAIALVLLVGAGLLIRTVQHLSDRELGFDSENLTWVQVALPARKYQSTETQLQFERDVLERVQRIPGVEAATASVGFPLWGGMMAGLAIRGESPGTPRREVAYLSVSPNFVRDVGARIVEGRDLLPTDDQGAPRAVVINETMARMFWPHGDAVGAEVHIGAGAKVERWITVVGIMADMRAHGLTAAIRPTAFGSTLQYSWPRRHIGVRTAGVAPASLATELKAAIHGTDPSAAIGTLTTAEENLSSAMARPRLIMLALLVFGGVALTLCTSGLYAVIVLNAQQRRREYAIRLALGARTGGVRWMVVRQALLLAGSGAVAGLVVAAVGTRVLQGVLHGVQPLDARTFAVSLATLITLAVLAAWHPARQAERVNPVDTLRAE